MSTTGNPTEESSGYTYEHDNGGEHKDRLPQSISGGASAKTTPANADGDSAGSNPATHDAANAPDFAYRKPGSETLVDKVKDMVTGK